MLLGQPAECLHSDTLDSIFGGLRQVWVGTHLPKDVGDYRLLCRVSHIHVEELFVEARLLGQASLCQHVSSQLGLEGLLFLRSDLFLRERFRCFGFTHAGEAGLFRLTLRLSLRHLPFKFRDLTFWLLNGRLLHRCGVFGQTYVVGAVDQLAFTLGQIRVGKAFTLELIHEHLGDVLYVGLNDRQQQLQALVFGGLLFLGLNLPVKLSNVGLQLQALLLSLGLLHLKLLAQLGRLIFSLKFLNLLGLQLVDHVTGLGVTLRCNLFGCCGFFPSGDDLTKQVRLCSLKFARTCLACEQRHLASFGSGTLGRRSLFGGRALWSHDRIEFALRCIQFTWKQLALWALSGG